MLVDDGRGVAVGVAGAGVGADAEPGRCTAPAGVPLVNGAYQLLCEVVAGRPEDEHAEFESARWGPAIQLLIEANKGRHCLFFEQHVSARHSGKQGRHETEVGRGADREESSAVGLVQGQPQREAAHLLRDSCSSVQRYASASFPPRLTTTQLPPARS
jgi:hypothetical protein